MIRYSHVSRPYICLHSSRDLTLHSCLRNFPSLQYSSRYSNTMCTIFFIFVFIIYITNIVPNYSPSITKMLRLHQPAKGILRNFPILQNGKERDTPNCILFWTRGDDLYEVSYFIKQETTPQEHTLMCLIYHHSPPLFK